MVRAFGPELEDGVWFSGVAVAPGEVLATDAPVVAKAPQTAADTLPVVGVVRETVLLNHLPRVRTSRPGEYGVNAEGLEAVVRTGLVVQHEGALLFDSRVNISTTTCLDRGGRCSDHLRFDCDEQEGSRARQDHRPENRNRLPQTHGAPSYAVD
jgi:hypothetical protein